MAETEFIGPGGIVRQTILSSQTGQTATVLNANPAGQWTSIKHEPSVVASTSQNTFYPTAYFDEANQIQPVTAPSALSHVKKVKHRTVTTMQPQSQPVTVSLAPVDIKPIPQTIIAQCSNAWTGNNTATLSDVNSGYQTIKWDHASPIVVTSKQTTLNTTGLHFISAPASGTAVTAVTPTAVTPAAASAATMVPGGMNVLIHGGRKTGTIIETFKCEVCNQIFSSMNALQNHVAQVHEVGLNKRPGKKTTFPSSTLHCEYKYSGLSLADSISGAVAVAGGNATSATQPPPPPGPPQGQQLPTLIATGGPVVSGNNLINTGGATFIQAPTNLTITSIGGNNMTTPGHNPGQALSTPGGIIITKNGKIRKEKKRNWECVMCHNRFSRKDHLAKHVSAVHEKIRPFECRQCGQKFSQKHHLRAHMLARHEDDKLAAKAFACQQCPKRFTRNDHLERHIESVHEKRKQFECQVCAHQFARKHHLSKHILAVHAKVKPYGCNQCDQSFLQRHHLGAHIMSVHQPPIQEEPDGTKSYVCAICSHRFKRKDHLKKHVETVHEKTRAFQCMLCERRFGQKYHLAIHVSAVHEGKKPYACDMCSHKSARKSGLQRHMRTVHNVKHPSIPSQPLPTLVTPLIPDNVKHPSIITSQSLQQPTLVTTLTPVDRLTPSCPPPGSLTPQQPINTHPVTYTVSAQ